MYATLGTVEFALITVTGIEETISYDYAEHRVIEGKPLLQFLGDNLDDFKLTIRLHFSFCNPEERYTALKAEAGKHQALPFFYANGKYLGSYVITEIAKTTAITADNGQSLCIEAVITLREWFESDPLGSREAAKKQEAPGLGSRGALTVPGIVPGNQTAMISGQITDSASQIKRSAGKIATLTESIKGTAAAAAAKLTAATSGITSKVAPIMQQARSLATDGAGASELIKEYAGVISSHSSAIARITSGLPGPLGSIGKQIAAANSKINGQTTQIITLSSLAGNKATETGTRAQMIARMLPK